MVNSWATIRLKGQENITKTSRLFKKLLFLTMLLMEKIRVYPGQK